MDASDWTWQWLDRTLPALRWETFSTCCLICLYALWIQLHSLRDQFRARRALKADPSGRAGIFAALNKRMHAATKYLLRLAMLYFAHALVLLVVDVGIGGRELANDLGDKETREQFDGSFFLTLLSILAVATATLVLAPLFQMSLAAWLVGRFARKSGATTLAAYIPAARVLATHMCFIWYMLFFAIVAFWSPFTDACVSRGLLMQATIGSGMAWCDAAHVFNYHADRLSDMKLVWPGASKAMRLFATKMVEVHSLKGEAEGLPQYADHVEEVALLDEKA